MGPWRLFQLAARIDSAGGGLFMPCRNYVAGLTDATLGAGHGWVGGMGDRGEDEKAEKGVSQAGEPGYGGGSPPA